MKVKKLSVLLAAVAVGLASGAAHAALVVGLDASTLGLLDGQNVAAWGPLTSTGTPTFNTNRTPNGGSAVVFNGTDRFSDNFFVPSTAAQDFIIATVIKPTAIGAYHNIIDDDVSNRPMLWVDNGDRYEPNFGGGVGPKAIGTGSGGWDVLIYDSRNNRVYQNSGAPTATGGGAIAYAAGENFDFFHRDGGQTFQGEVAEFRVYNDAADFGGNFNQLFSDLKTKWIGPAAAPAPTVLLDASTLGLSNGQNVAAWGGQTAGGTPTFLTGQTPNGGSAVEFNGTDRMGDNVFVPAGSQGGFLLAAVLKPNSINAYHNIIDDDVSNRPMVWIDNANNYEANFGGGTGAKAIGTGPGGWDIVIYDSATNLLYVNSLSPNATGGGVVAYTVGENFDFLHRDGGQTFQGLVSELRLYTNTNGLDIAGVFTDLQNKWILAQPVPEPGTMALLVLSGAGLLRRRRKA